MSLSLTPGRDRIGPDQSPRGRTDLRARRRRLPVAVSLAVAAGMALTGCQGDPAAGAGTTDRDDVDRVNAEPVVTTPPPAPVEATNLELPRTVSYIGVEYTITTVTLHATDPLYGPVETGSTDWSPRSRGVLVSLEARNTNAADLELPKADLITGAEVEPAAMELEQRGAGRRLAGGTTTEVEAFFRTDLADVSASSFGIREEGRVPVTIPLKGAVPASGYPVKGKAGPGLGAVGVFNGGSDTVKVEVTGAQLRLDSLPVYAEQAELGHRFIVLTGRARVATSPFGSPAHFTYQNDIRVLADDLAVVPSHCDGDDYSAIIQVGEIIEFSCAFPVKDSATSFAVSAGFASARVGSVRTAPITLGPLPALATPAT